MTPADPCHGRPVARILVAPAPFKGTLSAAAAAAEIARGLRVSGHHVVVRPLPDGGEGTLDALVDAWALARRAFARAVRVRGGRAQR